MPRNTRYEWVYPNAGGGSFAENSDGTWTERNALSSFQYQEVNRTPQYVELYDAARNLYARLYPNTMYQKSIDTGWEWQPAYNGHWE